MKAPKINRSIFGDCSNPPMLDGFGAAGDGIVRVPGVVGSVMPIQSRN